MYPAELARLFHETYERLADDFGYRTRRETAVPWDDVPENNRLLMIETCRVILHHIDPARIDRTLPDHPSGSDADSVDQDAGPGGRAGDHVDGYQGGPDDGK